MKFSAVLFMAISWMSIGTPVSRAQRPSAESEPAKLADLLSEAERSNPMIRAARQQWQAAQQLPTQVSTLPDPTLMIQQMSVGTPRPFSGYTNSEMANFGIGVSQDIPYPGKLRLRGQIAGKEAEVFRQKYESVRRDVLTEVKASYFRLSYLTKKLAILHGDGQLLEQVEQSAEARYQSGMGNQQEVLQSQLERTRLLREITTTQLEEGTVQAKLNQLLNRPPSSPEIITTELSETPIAQSYDQLLSAAKASDPDIGAAQRMIERQDLQVDLARKDFYPDFTLTYMWLQPDPFQYRTRFEFSLGIHIPIFRGRRQRPELAQAETDQNRARSELEAQSQQVAFELRQAFLEAEKSAELLRIYREGLVPQAQAEYQAGLAAYQSNRQDFQALLASFLDVLRLDEEYWQTLAQHETALAQIENLTGLSLR
jgi:cobalt-zinc-cadmium efflux system outer membrane protein